MRDFTELKVWQKVHRFVIDVYQQSRSFPPDERFGLTAHLRSRPHPSRPTSPRAAVARGNASLPASSVSRPVRLDESEYQLLLARDLSYLPDVYRQLDDQVNEVKRMLNSFVKTLS